MNTLLTLLGYAFVWGLLVAVFYVWNELRVYRRGGDVWNWTIKLDKFLKLFKSKE